jgi:FtsP/CotA-like multicopper oxidase with cupredoxin domain
MIIPTEIIIIMDLPFTSHPPALTTVRIAWLPDERPGSWMYHCHILEHHASGMMGHFDVVT